MRAPSLAFGVLALVGCERPTAPAANAPPVVPAQRAVDAAARPPLAPCERAAGEARKVLDHAAAGDAGADLGALRAMFTNRCMADPSGGRAWALVPERVRVDGRAWWARYALVRLGPEAGRFGAWPAAPSEDEDAASATPFNLWQQPGDSEVSVVSMSAYDYDRDGSPELALVLVTVDPDWESIAPLVPRSMRAPILFDPDRSVVERRFGTKLFPETWIIDRRGIIRARFDRTLDWTSPALLSFVRSL